MTDTDEPRDTVRTWWINNLGADDAIKGPIMESSDYIEVMPVAELERTAVKMEATIRGLYERKLKEAQVDILKLRRRIAELEQLKETR